MKILLGLFFCSVLVNTGTSLECEVCAQMGTSCVGKIETCEDGKDACAAILKDSSLDGYATKSIIKHCTYSKSCTNETQYIEYGTQLSYRAGIACCQENACRTALPELSKPLNDTQRNGKHCPACYSFLLNTCKEGEMVECRGPQDHCLDMEVTVSYGPIVVKAVVKGCVTKAICSELSLIDIDVMGIRTKTTNTTCIEAAPKKPDQPQEANPEPKP